LSTHLKEIAMSEKIDPKAMTFDAMWKRKEELTPNVGFSIVGVDSFEMGADALYFVEHFATREEADEELAKQQSDNPLDKFYIYDKNTH